MKRAIIISNMLTGIAVLLFEILIALTKMPMGTSMALRRR
jgi:hypothetical protein